MAQIAFTSHLRAVAPAEPVDCPGTTVGDLLEALAAEYPLLKPYLLDDQGRVRRHVAIFIDGELKPRETALSLPVTDASEVYVLQALSGG
jgi:sulfur carrier protein ThiS